MNNNIIIKYLLDNNYYNKYYNTIINLNSIKFNNKLLFKILQTLHHLKTEYPADEHTVSDLSTLFAADYPYLAASEKELADAIWEGVAKAAVDARIADALFQTYVRQTQAEAIADVALEVTQGRKNWGDLAKVYESTALEEPETENDFLTTNIMEVYGKESSREGLRWRLKTLNRVLGAIGLGDFGFIFARPEVGKTTWLASEVTFLGTQTIRPILWVNNEQRGTAVIPRCYSALFGVTEEEIRKDLETYSRQWQEVFGDRFLFIDNPGMSKSKIEAICKKHNPGLIVFDQLDKVHGFEAERYDLLMKAKYQWARELAKRHGPVIGVCQAGGTAENKRYLEMTDVDSSHTAKQGEADWVMGIGKSNEDGLQRIRYLSFCKNKLPSGPDTAPEMRHAKVEVFINEDLARYEDKIQWH